MLRRRCCLRRSVHQTTPPSLLVRSFVSALEPHSSTSTASSDMSSLRAGDLVLLTCVLALTSGATSPLVAGYFLIVMMSALRLDLRLTRCTTAAAVAGYVVLLGVARWPLGLAKVSPLPAVPRYQELMMI